jgi:hypothetical protein
VYLTAFILPCGTEMGRKKVEKEKKCTGSSKNPDWY